MLNIRSVRFQNDEVININTKDNLMRVVCMGEALIDFVSCESGPLTEASRFIRCIGGAAVNVAAGLHNQGIQSTLVSRVGRDQWGQLIINSLEQQGLSPSFVQIDPQKPTKCCFISHDASGSRFIEIANRQSADQDFEVENISKAFQEPLNALYISGVMLIHREGLKRVMQGVKLAKQSSAIIVFDPVVDVSRSAKPVKNRIIDLLPYIDLLKVNESEYAALCPAFTEVSSTPGLILHTKGADGAEIIYGKLTITLDAVNTECLDPTGAGDAFLAGFLAAYLKEQGPSMMRREPEIPMLKRWGNAGAINAARIIQSYGGNSGYFSND